MSYGVVLTDDVSRQGIIDALKRRHSYAATDNIIAEFRCGKHITGDIFDVSGPPKLEIKVLGTAPIAKISIIRDGKYVHVAEPKKEQADVTFTDAETPRGKTCYESLTKQRRRAFVWRCFEKIEIPWSFCGV
jgi:hypothetical protein